MKNNVAIASAITAYGRIHMMPFKLDPSCAYSDTDSVFTNDILKIIEESKELGMFKDELGGINITEATFLGIKQYGYKFEKEGKVIEKSVFAGVPRDSLSYEQILELSEGKTLHTSSKLRFYKSFINLNIKVKEVSINIKANSDKKLIENKYLPLHINVRSKESIVNKVVKILNKINNNFSKLIKSK